MSVRAAAEHHQTKSASLIPYAVLFFFANLPYYPYSLFNYILNTKLFILEFFENANQTVF